MDSALDYAGMVEEWHRKFGVDVMQVPIVPDERVRDLRKSLIEEEFREFCEASDAGDVVEVADAIADLLYVVFGAAHAWGIPVGDVFREVHRSNMSKVWPDGTVRHREDGKVLKPPTYSPANIGPILFPWMESAVGGQAANRSSHRGDR